MSSAGVLSPWMTNDQKQQHGQKHMPMSPPQGAKRKASFDEEMHIQDEDSTAHHARTPAGVNNNVRAARRTTPPQQRSTKRLRTVITSDYAGRSLPMERLLESQNTKSLRNLIIKLCERNPQLNVQVAEMVPRPTVSSSLDALSQYIDQIEAAFPYKTDPMGDYAYIRVKAAINDYISALSDYTAHFLPPGEQQISTSLSFLDGASYTVHRLPEWHNAAHSFHKDLAYHDLCQAWMLTISEGSKRAGGIALAHGGWMEKLVKHNDMSGGKLQPAIACLEQHLSWLGHNNDDMNNSATGSPFRMPSSPSPFPVFASPRRSFF